MEKLVNAISRNLLFGRIRGLFTDAAPAQKPGKKANVSKAIAAQDRGVKKLMSFKPRWVKKDIITRIEFSSVLIIGVLLLTVFIAITPPIRAGILTILNLNGLTDSGIREEVLERRTEHAKVFKNQNGTYTTLVFAAPIHYMDEKGQWQDLDGKIVDRQAAGASFYAKFGRTPKLEFISGATQLTLEPQNVKSVPGIIEENRITYVEAYDATDLKYAVGATQVEEEIILKSQAAPSSFSFKIISNVPLPPLENDELDFSTCGTLRPFARDAKGTICPVGVEMARLDDGDYMILKVDNDWLKEATYPIVVDSTIAAWPGPGSGKDAYVDDGQPDVNFGSVVDLGAYDNVATKTRSYLQFDLGSIPKGSTISNASVQLYAEDALGGNVYLRKVTAPWEESTINWNNQPLFEEVVDAKVIDAAARWFAWDITRLVKDWSGGKIPNYGIVLLAGEADTSSGGLFYSSNFSTDINLRPKLVVDYIPDNVPPGSVIKQPKNNIFLKGSTWTVSGSAADNPGGSGLAKVQVSTDGGSSWQDASGTDSWTYTLNLPNDGIYNIKSRAIDAAGNIEAPSGGVTVTVDNGAPNALITSPRGGVIGGALVITGSASDENFNYFKLRYGAGSSPTEWIDFGAVSFEPVLSGKLGSAYPAGINNGVYTVQLVVVDKAGNTSTDTVVVVIKN